MAAAFVGSATGVAVIVTMFGDGAAPGAMNVAVAPLKEIDPHADPVQPAPESVHPIAVLGFELGAGVSVAAKFAVVPALTVVGPDTEKVKWLVTVISADPDLPGSAALRAFTVTVGAAGRI